MSAAAVFSRHEDVQVRVGDFLDDKLQTLADLDTLEALLANVKDQHELLQRQLEDAEKDHREAEQAAAKHATATRERAAQFNRDQADIDRRLRIVTQSETSDDAVRKFEPPMERLRRLDVATAYIEQLKEVEALSNECTSNLGTSDENALSAYRRLQNLVTNLPSLQDAAEGAAPHIVDHITQVAGNLRQKVKHSFASELEVALKKIGWPKQDAYIPPALQEDWEISVGKLLDLQRSELEARESAARTSGDVPRPAVLLPFEVLVRPLEEGFRYHFEGDKPTNRLDSPERFLAYVVERLQLYEGFVSDSLQPVLLANFRGTYLGLNPVYINATSTFITALLPMARTKVLSILPKVGSRPQLLSHLIHELMDFDTRLREEWGYDGGYGVQGWKGLTWEVLVEKDWFGRWLQVEKNFALARYQEIIDTSNSGELDYDSVDSTATKPSKAAIRVNDLLETITDRYKPLASFSQKLRFLIEIQISIFDGFHTRLHNALEAYLMSTTTIGRTTLGISREEQAELQGEKGLDRLCRVYGSAEYLERAMEDWNDDIFFLELWAELQDRARSKESREQNVAHDFTVNDVAARTSAAIVDGDVDSGGLFDETSSAYKQLRVRSEGIIADVLTNNVREALRAYRQINPWATLTPTAAPSSGSNNSSGTASTALPPTPELTSLLNYLTSSISFLSRTLGPAPLRRIARPVCAAIDEVLFSQVVQRHSFSSAGARQFAADLDAVMQVLRRRLGAEWVERSAFGKTREGVRLLTLKIKTGRAEADSDSDDAEEGEGEDVRTGKEELGLWEVERRLFKDNESARIVLEALGCERLSEAEARGVLERRVEIAS